MSIAKLNKIIKNKGEEGYEQSPANKQLLQDMCDKTDEIIENLDCKIVEQTNTDLNDYTETGIFFFDASQKPLNIPVGSNGWLQVMKASEIFVKQIWWRAGTPNSNDFETYVRTKSTSWSAWRKYEIFEDSNWINLSLETAISVGNIKKKAQYRKIGKVVQLRGDVQGIAKGDTLIATLPENFRPSTRLDVIQPLSGVRYCRYRIEPNGQIILEWTSDSNYNASWYNLDITFMID